MKKLGIFAVKASGVFILGIGAQLPVFADQPVGGFAGGAGGTSLTSANAGTNITITGTPSVPIINSSGGTAAAGGTNGQTQYNNGGALAGYTPSGDVTVVPGTGVETVLKTNGTPFATSATTDTTNAANIGSGTLPAGRLPALTGDVTSSAGSAATTLASTAVTPGSYTNTNLTVDAKGRITAASNGSGGSANLFTANATITANTNAAINTLYPCDTSGGAFAVTLPDATLTANKGGMVVVYLKTAGNNLTVNTTSAQTMNGLASGTVVTGVANSSYLFIADGTNWRLEPVVPVASATSNQFVTFIDAQGIAHTAQPAFTNMSAGQITAAQMLALTNTHIYVGNGSNQPADVAVSGDATMANTGALTVTKTGGVSFAASATTDTTNATNISSGALPAGRMPALTGDVTSSVGAVATTIANSAVTNAKMANMNAHTYKGNNTGSAAAPADITSTQLTADLNLATSSLQGLVPATGGGTVNFLRADMTFAAPGGGGSTTIGGDGSDGAKSLTGTDTQTQLFNATTCTLSGAYTSISGSVYNCNGAFTTGANTWTVSACAKGGDANFILSPNGSGYAGGFSGISRGGGGGGCAGAGGAGQSQSTPTNGMAGQAIPGLFHGITGSGGGAGTNGLSNPGGGAGGGSAEICNSGTGITISTSGAINAVGQASFTSSGNGFATGGGGSGGVLSFYSTVSITHTGTCSVAGGASGAESGTTGWTGGGGGGGYGLDHSPSNTGAGAKTVSGGTAGTGTSGNGSNGSSGVWLTITGTPNYPLLTENRQQIKEMVASGWMTSNHAKGHEAPMFATARAQSICFGDGEHWATNQREHATQLAAWKAKDNAEFESICYELMNGETIGGQGKTCLIFVGDAVGVDAA